MSDAIEAPARPAPRPLCPARWGSEKGYVAVRDPFDGTIHEIPYQQATEIWKRDVTDEWRRRKGER